MMQGNSRLRSTSLIVAMSAAALLARAWPMPSAPGPRHPNLRSAPISDSSSRAASNCLPVFFGAATCPTAKVLQAPNISLPCRRQNLEASGYPVHVVVNGQRGMPPFGSMMSNDQVAAVVIICGLISTTVTGCGDGRRRKSRSSIDDRRCAVGIFRRGSNTFPGRTQKSLGKTEAPGLAMVTNSLSAAGGFSFHRSPGS